MLTPLQEYVLLQCRLELAAHEHGNDSPEADAIRDDMDAPFFKLTMAEMATANKFAETLNSFNIPERQ